MKYRPIIFSGESVRAILEGRKTQTRRVLKTQPIDILPMNTPNQWVALMSSNPNHGAVVECRLGVPGDRLWVRETWAMAIPAGASIRADRIPIYRADGEILPRWQSPLFMPRKYSRLTLEIVNVRVERVQDITQADAKAEGAEPWFLAGDGRKELKRGWTEFSIEHCPEEKRDYIKGYSILWDSLNAKRGYSWASNPWVWVVEFGRVEGGGDER